MSRQVLTAVAVLMVVAASNAALAGGCGGGKSSGHYGGVNVHHRFVATHSHYHKPVHTHVVSRPVVVVERPVVVQRPVVDHCHHPKFCLAYVCPGETLLDICGREYGNPGFWTKVSQFNGLPTSAPLVAGQPIKLPTIYDSGRMVASDSPVPPMPALGPNGFNPNGPGPQAGFNPGMPQGQPQLQVQQASQQMPMNGGQGMMQGQMNQGMMNQAPMQGQMQPGPMNQAPQMNMREAERVVPTFTAGSQLVLDGQQFGGTPGRVLMAMGPMELPVAVANWTPNEVVVQLPELPLTTVTNARLIVLDADNKLVTQSELQLAPKTSRLAMGN